jgi:hypothetical protein
MSHGNTAKATTSRFDVQSADGTSLAVWVEGEGPRSSWSTVREPRSKGASGKVKGKREQHRKTKMQLGESRGLW